MKTDRTSSYLSLPIFIERRIEMFFRFVLLGICLAAIIFIFDIQFPKLKQKYKKYKEAKEREKRKAAFRKKMKELEIK